MVQTDMVSIICPVYNVESYLDSCIANLVKQTYQNIEILLVDDGSSDTSPMICDKWASTDKRIRVFHKQQGGVSSARNIGIQNAHGKYICFVDFDDILETNAIEAMLNYHDGTDNTIVVGNYDRIIDFPDRPSHSPSIKQIYTNPTFPDYVFIRHGGYIWCVLIPRLMIFKNHPIFDTDLNNLEDVAWIGVLLCYAHSLVFLSDILYHYRRNLSSTTSRYSDIAWQAKSWIKVSQSINSHFKRNNCTNHRQKNSHRKMIYH